ncbi:predicted protein [Chaetoceros tenuissimus]|uniref:Uncharacterized protein n=1 Tax=Chaetoceros tenuissimus TaxID=426638 RepID=A0AAD3CMS9_9STRA|nr:predicted protein [Chaetoceros tenuissimus]
MVKTNCFTEFIKWIRFILWMFQFGLMYLWHRLFRCMSADEAIDRMAEIVEHHHPIEQPRWFGSRPKSIIPKPFHNKKNQEFSPKPVRYPKRSCCQEFQVPLHWIRAFVSQRA